MAPRPRHENTGRCPDCNKRTRGTVTLWDAAALGFDWSNICACGLAEEIEQIESEVGRPRGIRDAMKASQWKATTGEDIR